MDNQHRVISGYRELDANEIKTINAIKQTGENLREMIDTLRTMTPQVDQRWLSIAQTHLQQGIMAAVRSVAKPTTF